MPMLLKADVTYLLENTTFDEYDIREWFREFIKAGCRTCTEVIFKSDGKIDLRMIEIGTSPLIDSCK